MSATRSCFSCHRVYTAEQIERDPAWEPTRSGWRCGDCARARASEVKERAGRLIADNEEPWTLVLRPPAHGRFDECLECEALVEARAILLARGGLTKAEAGSLCRAVLSGVANG